MKTLISILNEGTDAPPEQPASATLSGSVLNDEVVALLSGRPSEEIKNLKGRAEADPAGLLRDVGVGTLPTSDSKIKNLEEIFRDMISGKNVAKDHPAQNFKDFFSKPEKVKSPNETAPGILIKLTPEAKKAVGKTGNTKRSLRVFAFWFASIITAINNFKPNYFKIATNNFKFQFASGEQALLIYVSSGKSWKNL